MPKVKLTITDSRCRSGYFKKGQDYALQNGADLDYGNTRAKMFDAQCPDEGRVSIHGEVVE